MKHVIFVLLFVLVLSGMAWAVEESNPTSGTQDVYVNVPTIFWLGWNGVAGTDEGMDVTFAPGEGEVMAGEMYDYSNTDVLWMRSNLESNTLTVSRSAWATSPAGLDGDMLLQVNLGGNWYDTEGDTVLSGVAEGTYTYTPAYYLNNLGLDDDPGAYSTEVTFTFSHI